MRKEIILSKLFVTLGAFLFCVPVVSLLGAAITPASPAIWLLSPLLSLLLACGVRALPRARRKAALFAAILISLFAPLFLGRQLHVNWLALIVAIPCTAVLIVHLSALTRASGEEYLSPIWYVGIFLYLLARLFSSSETFAPAKSLIDGFAPTYFVYCLFALNEQSLLDGMAGGRNPSRLMRWRNRLTTAGMALLLLLIIYLPAIRRGFMAVVAFFKRIIGAILAWLLRDGPSEALPPEPGSGRMDMSGLGVEIAEPSALLVFLEKLMRIAALAISIGLILLLLWFSGKHLLRLFKALIAKLRAYAEQVNEAYEDTVESLLDWGDVKRALSEKREKVREKRKAKIPWHQLTPREQVRRVYQEYLQAHPELPASATAQKALREHAPSAALYDKARYSSIDIHADEAQRMRDEIKER